MQKNPPTDEPYLSIFVEGLEHRIQEILLWVTVVINTTNNFGSGSSPTCVLGAGYAPSFLHDRLYRSMVGCGKLFHHRHGRIRRLPNLIPSEFWQPFAGFDPAV